MGRREIIAALAPCGIECVFWRFAQGGEKTPPYMVLNFLNDRPKAADGRRIASRDRWQLDLVTARRDEAAERSVQSCLDAAGIFWSKTCGTEASDEGYRTTYRFETLGE